MLWGGGGWWGHGFDSCRGLRVFLCPMLASPFTNVSLHALSFLRNLFHAAILKLQDDDTAIPSMQWQQDFLKTWRSVMFHYCFICITLSCNGCPHYANNFHYYANSLCSQNVTIMLKKSHYYAQNSSPDYSFFTLNKVQLLDILT